MLKRINIKVYFYCCIFNCYTPSEISLWLDLGLDTWETLSTKVPDLQSVFYHSKVRKKWPDKCEKVKKILSDKSALYKNCVIDHVIPKFLLIDKSIVTYPEWAYEVLKNKGLILKPSRGYSGKGVYHYYFKNNNLFFKNLNTNKIGNLTFNGNLDEIKNHWLTSTKTRSNLLLMPYISNSIDLPHTCGAVVLRIITFKEDPNSIVEVRYSWYEIPLGDGQIFIDKNGKVINVKKNKLSLELKNKIILWEEIVLNDKNLTDMLDLSESYSKKLHSSLSNINSIAWDWIPTKNNTLLLEGNSDFGLLIPQLVDHLNNDIYNYDI